MMRTRLLPLVPLLAAGLLLASSPARAQLSVSGPATRQSRALTNWFHHHIPVRFGARDRFGVDPLDDAAMEAYLYVENADGDGGQDSHGGDGQIDGIFENNPSRITLRVPAVGLPDMSTFAHEYGHYVWFNILSGDDRRRYERLYDRQRQSHHLVTRYAETDAVEGFAEAFSFYVCAPPLLQRRDGQSYQFLSQWPATPVP